MWYWNGCEVEIDGYKPDFCASYQSKPNPSLQDFTKALNDAVDALKKDTNFAGNQKIEILADKKNYSVQHL